MLAELKCICEQGGLQTSIALVLSGEASANCKSLVEGYAKDVTKAIQFKGNSSSCKKFN